MTQLKGKRVEYVGVDKSFGATRVLQALDLTMEPGEFVALLGPSGCGKTTALRLLAGFEHPDAGQVRVDGNDISGVPAHRRGIGMVFQAYSLFPHLDVDGNIAFGLKLAGVPRSEIGPRIRSLLDMIGMPGLGGRMPAQLSGGQQQRVALARALALDPGILLLDEPLSALDAQVRASLREEIRQLQLRLGITTLFVTHDQEEALGMADRVAVMNAGRIEQEASPAVLYHRPATPFVAGFVGQSNKLPIPAGHPVPEVWRPPHGKPLDTLHVRPEALACRRRDDGALEVVSHQFMGAATRVTARVVGADQLVRVDMANGPALDLAVGDRVDLAITGDPALRVLADVGAPHGDTFVHDEPSDQTTSARKERIHDA